MPGWVIAGWFANNQDGQSRAIAHWHHMRRVGWTTPEERVKVARERFVYGGPRCFGCGTALGRFPALCYWCRSRFWKGEPYVNAVCVAVDSDSACVARVAFWVQRIGVRIRTRSREQAILAYA
jgi:hypothetical protein